MADRKLRLLHFVVQPLCVWDDGEALSPGPTLSPFTVGAAELDAFPAKAKHDWEKLTDEASRD
jgi:hypothetical protein